MRLLGIARSGGMSGLSGSSLLRFPQRCSISSRLCAKSSAIASMTKSYTDLPISSEEPLHACSSSSEDHGATTAASNLISLPAYRRVGNVLLVLCVDHPFKFSWEVNRMLRELRLEYMGQTTILPDIPQVRRRLWRVRHVVRMDMLDLDEAKAIVGIPEHVTFKDLQDQISCSFGRGKSRSSPVIRSKANFMKLRRMRLRDVLHRDQMEKQLLEAARKR